MGIRENQDLFEYKSSCKRRKRKVFGVAAHIPWRRFAFLVHPQTPPPDFSDVAVPTNISLLYNIYIYIPSHTNTIYLRPSLCFARVVHTLYKEEEQQLSRRTI